MNDKGELEHGGILGLGFGGTVLLFLVCFIFVLIVL